MDRDTIKPGEKWEEVLANAIIKSKTIIVIWCSHARDSQYVNHEIELALELDKRIIPVLIDKTPLPDNLKKYQYIDLSDSVIHPTDEDEKSVTQYIGQVRDLRNLREGESLDDLDRRVPTEFERSYDLSRYLLRDRILEEIDRLDEEKSRSSPRHKH